MIMSSFSIRKNSLYATTNGISEDEISRFSFYKISI